MKPVSITIFTNDVGLYLDLEELGDSDMDTSKVAESGHRRQILELFQQCTHQEQLDILASLSLCLQRDFLVALPLELASIILSYLNVKFVLRNCLVVSKSWNQTIMSCNEYWRGVCISSGLLPQAVLKKEKERAGSYHLVAVTFLKLEGGIKRRFLAPQNFTTLVVGDDECLVIAEPVANGFYIKHSKGISPPLSLMRIDDDGDCVCGTVDNIFPNGMLQILWCQSTSHRVLLHTNNAMWVEFAFSEKNPGPPAITEWDSDTIFPSVYHQFSTCKHCSFVVVVSKSLKDQKWLEFILVELKKAPVKNSSQYVNVESPFAFREEDQWSKVEKVYLYSGSCKHGSRDFSDAGVCREHFIFVQLGYRILQFLITKSDESKGLGFEITGPKMHVSIPFPNPSFGRLHSSFTVSPDSVMLGLLSSYTYTTVTLNTWNLELGTYQQRELKWDPYSLQDVDLFSVGTLYTVLGVASYARTVSKKEVVVLRTETGEVVASGEMASMIRCGCNQEWMSSLDAGREPRLLKVVKLDKTGAIHYQLE